MFFIQVNFPKHIQYSAPEPPIKGAGMHFKCDPFPWGRYEQTCSHLKRGQVIAEW